MNYETPAILATYDAQEVLGEAETGSSGHLRINVQ